MPGVNAAARIRRRDARRAWIILYTRNGRWLASGTVLTSTGRVVPTKGVDRDGREGDVCAAKADSPGGRSRRLRQAEVAAPHGGGGERRGAGRGGPGVAVYDRVAPPAVVRFDADADPSAADTAAGFRFSYDYNHDGDFTDAGRAENIAEASREFAFAPGTHSVRGRVADKNGDFTDYTVTVVASEPGEDLLA